MGSLFGVQGSAFLGGADRGRHEFAYGVNGRSAFLKICTPEQQQLP